MPTNAMAITRQPLRSRPANANDLLDQKVHGRTLSDRMDDEMLVVAKLSLTLQWSVELDI